MDLSADEPTESRSRGEGETLMEQAACAQASPVARGQAAGTAAEGAGGRAVLGGSNCGQGAARGAALEEAHAGGMGAALEEAHTGEATDAHADLTMADNAALRVAAEAGPSAGSQAAGGDATPAKAQPPAKRAATGEAAPADGQPPAKRARQAVAPAAAVTLPSSAEAKAALLQQLEAEIGQLVKDAADMGPLAALPAALSGAQKAKGLVRSEVGLQHWRTIC